METFVTAAVAFIAGASVSFVNYLISRASMRISGSLLAAAPFRGVFSVAFIVAAYFAAKSLGVSMLAALLGGALGLTAGLAVSTVLLMRSAGEQSRNRKRY